MKLELKHEGKLYSFDLSKDINISIPVQRSESVSSFQIAGAVYKDYQDGEFIGNKNKGGSVNLETVTFTAHGNGSHTECLGHISLERYYVNDCIKDSFYLAKVLSLNSKTIDKGDAVNMDDVDWKDMAQHQALVIRTLPNVKAKQHMDYSGRADVPCILPEDMQKIVDAGIEHLLVDLPSVDPEWDEGKLASHHIFWNFPNAPRINASISEFVYVPDQIEDGTYVLKLNISNFISDAAPSTPTLYPQF